MATNYSEWSLSQLEKEKGRIDKAIQNKESESKQEVKDKIESIARQSGFDVSELFGSGRGAGATGKKRGKKKASARAVSKVAPKYQNPNGPETWAGRGRQPRWVSDHVEAGGDKEDLAI